MFAVGLTGGIASGKTRISDMFAERLVPVIDTDVISRGLLEPGEQAFDQVVAHFGDDIVSDSGAIDRARLRSIVFSDSNAKTWLETMLHPLIYQRSHEAIKSHSAAAYVLVVVPLLFESSFQSLVDRVLAVDCDAETQLSRLVERDGISIELAEKMLGQQFNNKQRLARAHDIIENGRGASDLAAQVDSLHQQYLQLADA